MSKTSNRAVIYCRISDDREGKAAGVDRQRKECLELAESLGWEVVGIYTDNSISAYSGKPRPEYRAMFEKIRNREADAVIAWAVDRMIRHPRELEDLIDLLEETGTKIKTKTSGEYDLQTADGRAHARIVGAIARQESEKKAERVRDQKRHAIAKGQITGGRRAFGWSDSRKSFVPEEIEVVREMGHRVLAGESVSGLTNDLNERGIRTSQGKPWTRASVRQLLTNPATAGLRSQPDGGVVEGSWSGAWDRDTWHKLCAVLNDPSRRTTHRLRSYLLTGLVYDHQGRKLITGHDKRGRTYRGDTNVVGGISGSVSISADLVEEVVVAAVLDASDKIVLQEPEKESPLALVDALNGELEALSVMYGKGEISAAEWNGARLPLQARINEARKSAPAPALVTDWKAPGQLRAAWDGLSLAQKRDAIEGFVDLVTISNAHGEGRKIGADRVSITWRLY